MKGVGVSEAYTPLHEDFIKFVHVCVHHKTLLIIPEINLSSKISDSRRRLDATKRLPSRVLVYWY